MSTDIVKELQNAELQNPRIDLLYKGFFEGYRHAQFKPRYIYVEFIEEFKGIPLLRTFAFKSQYVYREVCRRLAFEKEVVLYGIYNNPHAGRIVEFYDNYTYRASSNYWWFNGIEAFDKQEVIERFNIPYCQYFNEKNNSGLPFFEYITRYMQFPKIELLVKADLSQFVGCCKKLNLKAKSLDKIFRISNYWVPYLKDMQWSDIMIIKNEKRRIKTFEDLQLYKENQWNMSYGTYLKRYLCPKLINFFIQSNTLFSDMNIYNDYLRLCDEFNLDLNDMDVLVNKEYKREHDRMAEIMHIKKTEGLRQGIFDNYRAHLDLTFSKGDLIIFPAQTVDELENESKELNHCVKTYAKNVSEGKTTIFFIRNLKQIEKPLATLELKDNRIIQCRANRNSVPDNDVIDLLRKWASINEFKHSFDAD